MLLLSHCYLLAYDSWFFYRVLYSNAAWSYVGRIYHRNIEYLALNITFKLISSKRYVKSKELYDDLVFKNIGFNTSAGCRFRLEIWNFIWIKRPKTINQSSINTDAGCRISQSWSVELHEIKRQIQTNNQANGKKKKSHLKTSVTPNIVLRISELNVVSSVTDIVIVHVNLKRKSLTTAR